MSYLDFYKDKNVVVTGGSGSIGQAVVSMLYGLCRHITIFSRDEALQDETLKKFPSVLGVIGDVRSKEDVRGVCARADVIIHTAGMKYVEKCEENVWQAVETNVIGAQNIYECCAGTPKIVVMVSTDKAVKPEGVMGFTKRLQEKIVTNSYVGQSKFVLVRFGNVLGSRGSVVWKFKQQYADGKLLTVTNPEMMRFVMTPRQAAELILWSGSSAPNQTIVTKVMNVASIIAIASAITGGPISSVEFETVGVRDGEKLSEHILNDDEGPRMYAENDAEIGPVMIIYPKGVDRPTSTWLERKNVLSSSRELSVEEIRLMLIEAGVLSND